MPEKYTAEIKSGSVRAKVSGTLEQCTQWAAKMKEQYGDCEMVICKEKEAENDNHAQ